MGKANLRGTSSHWMNKCYKFWKVIGHTDSVLLKIPIVTRNSWICKVQHIGNGSDKVTEQWSFF